MLIVDELLAQVGLVGVDFHGALAGLRQAGDAQDVSIAFGVDSVAGLNGAQRLQSGRVAGVVPDVPKRGVFFAKAPQGESLETELARSSLLVQNGRSEERR